MNIRRSLRIYYNCDIYTTKIYNKDIKNKIN